MMTLRQMASGQSDVPATVAWALADIGEARGKQELFTRQSPQRLRVLREHALIESAISSNRIEGVTVEQDRARSVIIGKGRLRDRDEEEVRGYRDALRLIEIKGLAAETGTVALTPNEKRVAEDRRDCYWLYVVTRCKRPDGPQVMLIGDPARLAWHEVKKVEHYQLSVSALTPASSEGVQE